MRRLLGSFERSLALLNAIGDGVNALNGDGQLIYANDAIARFTGYSTGEELMAASPDDLAARFSVRDEEGNPISLSDVPGRRALKGEDIPEKILHSYASTTGAEYWLSVRAWPVFDDDGKVEFSVTVARDITELKNQDIRLQFLAEASRTLTGSLEYETTLANVAKLATPRFADWCAVDLVEDGEIRRVAVAHVDPKKVELAYELQRRYPPTLEADTGLAKVIKTGQSDYYPRITNEMMIAAAGEDEYLLRIVLELNFRSSLVVPLTARGRTFGAITLVTTAESGRYLRGEDVTLAEELGRIAALAVDNARLYAQAESERERYEVTLKSIGDAVIATDEEARITFINDVAQSLTGWKSDVAIGMPIAEVFRIVNEDTRLTVESPVDRVLREGMIVGLANHTILLAKDGREVPIDDSGAPIRSKNGTTDGVVLVFRDITERKAFELEREALLESERQARLEAEEADQLKLKFLAMISHELRTPLTSIKGFSTTLLADDVEWSAENQREFISIIDVEADKLTDLIEQLLDISRMQSGTLRINPELQPAERLISAARPSLERFTVDHPLEFDLVDELPLVKVDSHRIIQVLFNLVENASKYSPQGTPIQVTVRQENHLVQFSVSDEGIGIPVEEHQHVFEAFRQVERKEQAKGAGLGLAICKGLVEAHGGKMWIESKTPGTRMVFTLPVA
jgi:PAS domain S-box-containing protein